MKQGLSRVWAPIDWLVEWVQHRVDTQTQQRTAMLTILITIPVGISGPFLPSGILQQLIYAMSAIALTLTGITWLAGLQATRAAEESAEGGTEHQVAAAAEIPPPVP